MTNLSSLSKVQYANIASLVIFTVALIIEVYHYGFDLMRIINIANFALAWYMFVNIKRVQSTIKRVATVIKDAEEGELSGRITHITEGGELKELSWNINDLLDQLEVFMKEMQASINYASKKKFFRHALSSGLRGAFKINAEISNKSIDAMQENERYIQRTTLNAHLGEIGRGITGGMVIIQEDLTREIDGIKHISENASETADQSTKSLETIDETIEKINQLIQTISTKCQ